MSYADKHRHEVECTIPQCEALATKLRLINGRPFWVCERHDDELEASRSKVG